MNFTFMSVLLLLSFSWISVSGSESQAVEVQSGENVVLRCSNISESSTHAFWSKLLNRTRISCISSTYGSNGSFHFCDGFQTGKFEMRSSITTISLTIQQVNLSDSGVYFCGFYTRGHTQMNVIHLNVQGDDESYDDTEEECKRESDGINSVVLGSLAVFLSMVIIGLVVKNRELQTAGDGEQSQQRHEDVGSDDLRVPTVRSRRPAAERDVETRVIYTASR